MWEALLTNPVFIVFAFLTVTSVVTSISFAWRKVKQTEIEAQLKTEMIQRGMSADDIKKVIEASPSNPCRRGLVGGLKDVSPLHPKVDSR
jgi:hypothetical protein